MRLSKRIFYATVTFLTLFLLFEFGTCPNWDLLRFIKIYDNITIVVHIKYSLKNSINIIGFVTFS